MKNILQICRRGSFACLALVSAFARIVSGTAPMPAAKNHATAPTLYPGEIQIVPSGSGHGTAPTSLEASRYRRMQRVMADAPMMPVEVAAVTPPGNATVTPLLWRQAISPGPTLPLLLTSSSCSCSSCGGCESCSCFFSCSSCNTSCVCAA